MAVEYADTAEFESAEWGESGEGWESEAAEARRRTPARPGRYTPPPAAKGYVTQQQFQTAMDKVRADVAKNATAISAVGRQVDAVSKRARAEIKAIREDVNRLRDETRNTLQTLAILPLLATGGTATVMDTSSPPVPVQVSRAPDSLSQLLPLLLLSGSFGGFGGGPGGGTTGGGMDSGLMLAVALMAAHRP